MKPETKQMGLCETRNKPETTRENRVQWCLLCLVGSYVDAPSAVAAAPAALPFFFRMRFFLSPPCMSLFSPFLALRTERGLGPLARFFARA